LTGLHETAKIDQFSYGVAARNCSVRIPRQTQVDGYVRLLRKICSKNKIKK
jgi:glutamine synthetase